MNTNTQPDISTEHRIRLEIAKETSLKNYDDSIRVIDKLRFAGNDHAVKISYKKHRAMFAFAKSQLGEKLKRILSAEKHLRS